MTASLPVSKQLTFDEFLAFETNAEEKHEFVNGKIKEMAGATTDHNDIAVNIYAYLDNFFFEMGDRYRVTNSDTMIYIEEYRLVVFSDKEQLKLFLTGKKEFTNGSDYTIGDRLREFKKILIENIGLSQGYYKKILLLD